MPTIIDLGQKVKAKYPQYSDLSDLEVGQKMKAKFPDAYGDFSEITSSQPSTPMSQPKQIGIAEKVLKKASDVSEATFGRAADTLFGSTGKAVGGLITSGIGSAKVLAGQASGNQNLVQSGKKLEQSGSEQITPGNIAFTALELYPGGGAISKNLKKLPGGNLIAEYISKLPDKAKNTAIKLYAEALAPTTNVTKKQAGKIVPELISRKVTGSLPGILKKATTEVEEFGTKIGDFIEKLPQDKKVVIKPLIDTIENYKNNFVVDGVVTEPQAIQVADSLLDVVKKFGDKTNNQNLIRLRRIWDEQIAKRKGFEKSVDQITSFGLEVKKEASNSIRNILAKENPDLALLNKEFSFWKNVQDVVGATVQRTKGQSGRLRERIGAGVGAMVGATTGPIGAVIGTETGRILTRIFNSARYKTNKAVLSNRITKALLEGKVDVLSTILKEVTVGVKNVADKD